MALETPTCKVRRWLLSRQKGVRVAINIYIPVFNRVLGQVGTQKFGVDLHADRDELVDGPQEDYGSDDAPG